MFNCLEADLNFKIKFNQFWGVSKKGSCLILLWQFPLS